jgi:hypothetical protein
MRSTALGIAACLLAYHLANATPSSVPKRDHEEFPFQTSVSEVPKDGHPIHNRLTFECEPAKGSGGSPPKKIDCIMVQQDLLEPSPQPSKEVMAKQLTEGDRLKELCEGDWTRKDESPQGVEFKKKVAKACSQPSRTAVVDALIEVIREMEEPAYHTCTMATTVFRITFAYVKKGVWVSNPDPMRTCPNVAITRTLRADISMPSGWDYAEVTVATPPKGSLCRAESGTTEFTWRQVVTASQLNCRSVEM